MTSKERREALKVDRRSQYDPTWSYVEGCIDDLADAEEAIREAVEKARAEERELLDKAIERMDRAHSILHREGVAQWRMLDTSDLKTSRSAPAQGKRVCMNCLAELDPTDGWGHYCPLCGRQTPAQGKCTCRQDCIVPSFAIPTPCPIHGKPTPPPRKERKP
jgi:hypothetical protein